MSHRCLYCYEPIKGSADFHEKCSQDFFGRITPPELPYTLADMASLAKEVVERSVAVPGVQPKLSLTLVNEAADQTDGRLTVVGALGGNFILKPPSADFEQMPANEHVTMRIAQAFGIPVVPSSLMRLQSGELAYITRRIDRRPDNTKIHMLDMFQITEAFDKYRSSMERVGKAVADYSENTLLDLTLLFDLTLFCFVTGNNDMHLKNFSLIKENSGWKLAPAYDLLNVAIINPDDNEELALTLGAKKRKLGRKHFEQFGLGLGLTTRQVEGAFRRLLKNQAAIGHMLSHSFLSPDLQKAYEGLVHQRYAKLV